MAAQKQYALSEIPPFFFPHFFKKIFYLTTRAAPPEKPSAARVRA